MNQKALGAISGALITIAIIVVIGAVLVYFGVIPLSMFTSGGDGDGMEDPIGSEYCGYTDGQIIDMWENFFTKDLNNDIGLSVIAAMHMKACGTNSKTPDEIISNYKTLYAADWHLLDEDTRSMSGYYYSVALWGDNSSPANSTMILGTLSAHGTTVKTWYDYETITITSSGTRSAYLAFLAWIA